MRNFFKSFLSNIWMTYIVFVNCLNRLFVILLDCHHYSLKFYHFAIKRPQIQLRSKTTGQNHRMAPQNCLDLDLANFLDLDPNIWWICIGSGSILWFCKYRWIWLQFVQPCPSDTFHKKRIHLVTFLFTDGFAQIWWKLMYIHMVVPIYTFISWTIWI